MIHVYGWDPGETTGWCHISVHEGEIGIFNSGETDHMGIGNLLNDNQALITAVEKRQIEITFAVERYQMNSKITPSPWSLETTGLIRFFAFKYHIPIVFETPSAAKKLITNDVLKRAGLYVPGQIHGQDAVRQALHFLTTKKGLLTRCLID